MDEMRSIGRWGLFAAALLLGLFCGWLCVFKADPQWAYACAGLLAVASYTSAWHLKSSEPRDGQA